MTDLKPCPLCGANMLPESDGYEHPADDTCPLDSLYIEARHVAAWNTRAAIEAPVQEPLRIPSVMQHVPTFVSDRTAAPPHWLTAPDETAALRREPQPDALAAERKLADDLIGMVEGIDGAMNHGTWRDDHGTRLKDTPQWVAFYIAARRKE